jgi:lipopolysaccharide/colanic/teichoic acid biosynthesis glycosyltransferase
MKRALDMLVALAGLLLLLPLFAVVSVLIRFDSRGPVFFRQERIGQGFRPFLIYKFRTMVEHASQKGGMITVANDPRVTRVGRVLRKTKIDELPQLFNVLKGDMSLVGPRPEVSQYVNRFPEDYLDILQVRPGITDLASLKYRDEATALAHSTNPDNEYLKAILPDKISLAKEYIKRSSLLFDLKLIGKTVIRLFA